jgi:hypothetical protein
VFYCFWHVRQTWLKHSFKKNPDPLIFSHVFKAIVYLQGVSPHPSSQGVTKKETLIQLSNLQIMYPSAKSFFDYVDAYWVLKTSMWCTNAWNIPRANQDTNFIIEVYHMNLKKQLKSTWGIERLAFPSFKCKDYDNLFVNPWIKYDTRIE